MHKANFVPALISATWTAFQINFVKEIAFYLGCDNSSHIYEYKSVLGFYRFLGVFVTQCFASVRMPNVRAKARCHNLEIKWILQRISN
jgi:hypothetical protein